jgi:hypothetical protein
MAGVGWTTFVGEYCGMISPLDMITKFYLESDRFNGYPFRNLEQELEMSFNDAFDFVKGNVNKEVLTVVFGDIHPNPHIKAFPEEPKETILEKLDKNKNKLSGNYHFCLYPTKLHLKTIVTPDDYRDRPYTYEMALGAGQLEFRYFELTVLEFYRNDPRYCYWCDDINVSQWV